MSEAKGMETASRVAALAIVVEEPASVEQLNATLHAYAEYIIGRMGVPYRTRGISVIMIALDAPADVISGLSGKIGALPGVSAKAAYSKQFEG